MRAICSALVLLTALTGCGDDFTERSLIEDYRVIGVEADHPEARPSDTVRLVAHDIDPAGRAITYTWHLCLFSGGALADFECADPALRFALGDGPTATLDLAAYDLPAFVDALGGVPGPDGRRRTLADGIDVYVELVSGPAAAPTTRTIKRVRVRTAGEPNQNPAATLEVSPEPDGAFQLRVVPADDARQAYVDDTRGPRVEELTYAWYATSGAIEAPVTYEDDTEVRYEPNESGTLIVAIRDGRGGLTVLRRPTP